MGNNKIRKVSTIDFVEQLITQFYEDLCDENYLYHNLGHVKKVVNVVEQLGKGCNLTGNEIEILKISAWFHDVGYLFSNENHEKKSASLAYSYLRIIKYPTKKIEQTISCIMATYLQREPSGLLEEIMRDADLSHLGSSDYFDYADKLYEEIKRTSSEPFEYKDWIISSVKFFEDHNYYTDYANKLFNDQKNENFKKLVLLSQNKLN